MNSEVFRFVVIRPPQQAGTTGTSEDVVDLGRSQSPFIGALRSFRSAGDRSSMVKAAEEFVRSEDFIDSPRKLDSRVAEFIAAVQRPSQDFWNAATEEFKRLFDSDPSEFVGTATYIKHYMQTADSIVAAAIHRPVSSRVRSQLVMTARVLWLIQRMASEHILSRTAFASALLVLPEGIFPLPVVDVDLRAEQEKRDKANEVALAAHRRRQAELATNLSSYRHAADELLSAFQRSLGQPAVSPAPRRGSAVRGSAARGSAARGSTARGSAAGTKPPAGFVLPDAAAQSLSDATRATLQRAGIPDTQIDVVKTIAALERQATVIAHQLYANTGSRGVMVRIGNLIVPRGALDGGFNVVLDPGPDETRTPGPCPPAIVTTQPTSAVTVPTGHGEARILGIADLMVLEQELLRYQLGEIAHIENVLQSEVRSRRFRTTDTTEQTQVTETETTTEKEQDLSTTERFELQTESQTVISQNSSQEAGLTIHASYGPSVDATANYNVSSSTSTQQSNTASTNFAREITNKAVERVQTRMLTRRTVTTTRVIEEINKHAFDNKVGTGDIVGIYRYIDKLYRAQIVNYGKRLMLEFIVPEPAAFLRYALTNKPIDSVTEVNPSPPGYCLADGKTFVPLEVADMKSDEYLHWASVYGAQDVTPPPSSLLIATAWKKSPDAMPTVPSGGPRKISSDAFDVTIPEGYLCQSAYVNIYGETQSGAHKIVYQLQKQQGVYVEPGDDNITYDLEPSPTLSVTINSLGFHNYEVLVTCLCVPSEGKVHDWQLKTFTSIMNAYNDMRSAYDQAIREAKLRASDTTAYPPNPLTNAATVQTELKKGCLSLLTGQRFDLFDAVRRNIAPYGYPEIDFAEAKAEGEYVAFFEQSFEWNNMVYVFYPYFWGKKDSWVTIAQLTDNDPLFGQFLRAGAARVQVPVRVGFNDAILTYLSTGELWAGEGTLVNSDDGNADPLPLSIVDELKSQTGNNNIEGKGTLGVTKNSAAVTGSGTEFTTDDENRRIVIAGATYVIRKVEDPQTIALNTPFAGESDQGLAYALGGKLIGQPWEVKLPTNLVKLDGSLIIT